MFPDTSKRAYKVWLETKLLPNEQPPSYMEWVKWCLTDKIVIGDIDASKLEAGVGEIKVG